MTFKTPLRLKALDSDDALIISATLQDSLTKTKDIHFDRQSRTLTIELNRFKWERAQSRKKIDERVRAILLISDVTSLKAKGISISEAEAIHQILSLQVARSKGENDPSAEVIIHFAGGGGLKLGLECIDIKLMDSDVQWATSNRPDHDEGFRKALKGDAKL